MIGRVIVEQLASGGYVVDANGHGAREASLVGHGVRVRVEARVVSALASHVVPRHPAGVVAILAEELLGGDFGHEDDALELGGAKSLGPGNPVLEEPRAGAVHFQSVQHVPLLERPGCRTEAGGVDRL